MRSLVVYRRRATTNCSKGKEFLLFFFCIRNDTAKKKDEKIVRKTGTKTEEMNGKKERRRGDIGGLASRGKKMGGG